MCTAGTASGLGGSALPGSLGVGEALVQSLPG